jgi:two-component system sensor histidine kinase BarA
MSDLKIIDQALALERAGGNPQLADELFKMLLSELPAQRRAIASAMTTGDYVNLLHHVHKLNGGANYCGVPALKQALDTLETKLKNGHNEQAAGDVNHVLFMIDRTLEAGQKQPAP